MCHSFRFRVAWLVILGLAFSILNAGCDPWQSITYENQTASRVKVDLGAVPVDYGGTPTLTWHDPGVIIEAGQSKKYSTSVRSSSKSRTINK